MGNNLRPRLKIESPEIQRLPWYMGPIRHAGATVAVVLSAFRISAAMFGIQPQSRFRRMIRGKRA